MCSIRQRADFWSLRPTTAFLQCSVIPTRAHLIFQKLLPNSNGGSANMRPRLTIISRMKVILPIRLHRRPFRVPTFLRCLRHAGIRISPTISIVPRMPAEEVSQDVWLPQWLRWSNIMNGLRPDQDLTAIHGTTPPSATTMQLRRLILPTCLTNMTVMRRRHRTMRWPISCMHAVSVSTWIILPMRAGLEISISRMH